MPASAESLMSGYDSTRNVIWIIGDENLEAIWYFNITSNLGDPNLFKNVGTLTKQIIGCYSKCHTQLGNSIYWAQDNGLYQFDMSLGSILGGQNEWFSGNWLGTPVEQPCLANNGRYIFVIGGHDGISTSTGLTTFQIYDTVTGSWFIGSSLKEGRLGFTCEVTADGTYLYAIGGRKDNNNLASSVEKISVINMSAVLSGVVSWSITSVNMSTNKQWMTSVIDSVNNLIYVIGGKNGIGGQLHLLDDELQIIDPSTDTNMISAVRLNMALHFVNAIMVKGIMYRFGGRVRTSSWEFSNTIYTATPTNTPSNNPTLPPTNPPTLSPSISPAMEPTFDPTNN
eukprot:516103_1